MTATTSAKLRDIGALDEFPHAVPRIIQAGSRELVVYRWHDEVVALKNVCAHQGLSFRGGKVIERVSSGQTRSERTPTSRPELVCPIHGYSYDAAGRCRTHEHLRIRSYDVELRDGRVLVAVA
jgi:nitrite reductase/ring-hydroxylating ferredoxin subunit